MPRRLPACRLAILLAGALAVASLSGSVGLPRSDAESFNKKLASIEAFGNGPPGKPHQTIVTENELNAWLEYDGRALLPAGVVNPVVTVAGQGRLSGRANVDLDEVRKQRKPTSVLDPMAYLTGRLSVTASGVLTTNEGVGRFALESATVGGLPVPKSVLQQIVAYYSRTPDSPAGINLDDPFALPARIREIQVQQKQAVIVQ